MAHETVFAATPAPIGGGKVYATPFQFLFTGEDKLRVVIMNSAAGVTVQFDCRFLNAGEKTPQAMAPTFRPTADRMPNTFDFDVGVGYLLNCSLIVVSGAPLVGQTYVMVQIVRGGTGATLVLGCLLGGYITAMQHLAYPGSPIESSIAGGGYVRQVVGSTPALGAEVLETVPTGARWELLAWDNHYFASAAGGNRWSRFAIKAASFSAVIIVPPIAVLTPSAAWNYFYAQGFPLFNSLLYDLLQPLPINLQLIAGSTIGTLTQGLDPGDAYSAPVFSVREWLEAA